MGLIQSSRKMCRIRFIFVNNLYSVTGWENNYMPDLDSNLSPLNLQSVDLLTELSGTAFQTSLTVTLYTVAYMGLLYALSSGVITYLIFFYDRCDNCGEYIYKGKKFNSRKEDVEDEYYLGLRIFRFYIKCPRCVSEIAFKVHLQYLQQILDSDLTWFLDCDRVFNCH